MKLLASLHSRIIAFILDLIIVWGGLTLINFIIFITLPMNISNSIGTFSVILMVGYLFIKDGFRGQSIGKKIVKIKVVHEQSGFAIEHPHSFIRSIPLVFLFPIDILFSIGAKRQRLGDIFAKTSVIKTDA